MGKTILTSGVVVGHQSLVTNGAYTSYDLSYKGGGFPAEPIRITGAVLRCTLRNAVWDTITIKDKAGQQLGSFGAAGTSGERTCRLTTSYDYKQLNHITLYGGGVGTQIEGGSYVTVEVDWTYTTSGLTLSSGTVAAGGSVTANIAAHDKTFAHEIRLAMGQRLNIQRIDPGVGSAQVTVPMEWLDQLPHASTGAATVTLETLSGTQVLGKVSQPLTVTVPASAAPTFTASCAPLLSVGGVTYPSMGAGVYVQGKSGCTAQITGAAAKYGAGVASYSIRGGGYAGTAATLATGLLTQAGAVPFVFRVTDTRGLVTEKTVNITVKPYAPPQVTELRGWRVNESGAASLSGTRGMVRSVWGFSALDGANTCTAAVYLRPGTEAEKPLNAAMVSGETYPVADASGSLTLPLTVTYTLRLVLTDRYGAVERTATLPSANFAMHFNAKGNSVAFGKACEHENAFEIAQGRVVYCQGGRMNSLMGVMATVDDCDKALRSGVYACANTAAHLPIATWGTLLVMTGLVEFEHRNGTIEQLFIPLGGGGICAEGRTMTSPGAPG